jgi:hypothetical protein
MAPEGFEIYGPILGSSEVTPTFKNVPNVLATTFDVEDAIDYVGPRWVALVQAIRGIYQNRIYGRGLFTPYQETLAKKLLEAGLVMVPRTDNANDKLAAIAAELRKIRQKYNAAELEGLQREAVLIDSDLSFWNNVYAVAAVVAAPVEAVKEAARHPWLALGSLGSLAVFAGFVWLIISRKAKQ